MVNTATGQRVRSVHIERASGRLDQVRVLAVERVGADGGWLIVADPDRVRRTVARLHVPRLHW